MSVLTKAFVVVVTILSVVLVTLTIAFAAQVPNREQDFQDMKQQFTTQLQESSAATAKARAEMAEKGEDIKKYLEQIRQISEDLEIVKSERTGLEAKLAEATNTNARNSAALQTTVRVNESKDTQLATQAELINTQIASIGELKAMNADSTQTLINVREDNRRLANNYRRIQEELKALSTRNEELQARIEDLNTVIVTITPEIDIEKEIAKADVRPKDGQVIRGSVVKIEQIQDLTFVQVNVGTRDLVKEGMEFTVYRGDSFVGNITIASVDIDESVGRLTLGTGIQEGDAIRAGGR